MDAAEAAARTTATKTNIAGRAQAVQGFIDGKIQEAADQGEVRTAIYPNDVVEPGLRIGVFNPNTIKQVYENRGFIVVQERGHLVISWSHLV